VKRRRAGRAAACLALPLCVLSGGAAAGEFDEFDFSLRFPAAISRFSTYADVAGVGGASAGSKFQSSINPAGTAWEPMPADTRFTASPQFTTLGFDEGTRLNVFVESLTIDTADSGRFIATLAQVRSNEAAQKSGLDYAFDLDLALLTWGKRFAPEWAAGLAVEYARSTTELDVGPFDVARSKDRTFLARGGLHYLATSRLHLGLVAEYALGPSETELFDVAGLGIGTIRIDDTTHQVLLRPGLAYEYAPGSTLYADYQYGRFSNDAGVLIVHRFLAGAEQRVLDWLFLRGGMAADTRGNVAFTAGVGLYPTPETSIDVGFQENFFPELEPEFGRSRTFSISASLSF
jgi:hypothetical protein